MTSPLQAMRSLLEEDRRYKIDAYQFIREALQYAHENLESIGAEDVSRDAEGPRHLTGQQLCIACRLYAIEQYGYLAKMVLAQWGIRSTGDLGEMVYNLIRIEQMRKSESDRREDFDDVYDFDDAFEPTFELATQDNPSG
ncbi:MAG: Minf_1886 family protein [Planctomycetota bacterium]